MVKIIFLVFVCDKMVDLGILKSYDKKCLKMLVIILNV